MPWSDKAFDADEGSPHSVRSITKWTLWGSLLALALFLAFNFTEVVVGYGVKHARLFGVFGLILAFLSLYNVERYRRMRLEERVKALEQTRGI